MCGRFANAETIPTMAARFAAVPTGGTAAWKPSWNICPTRDIPVIVQDDQRGRRLGMMAWGWHPMQLQGKMLINCRGEEAHTKRMFADALDRRRCLIPASAYYEWKRDPNNDRPLQSYACSASSGAGQTADTASIDCERTSGLFAIAGLWVTEMKPDGARHGHVVVITIPAGPVMAQVHDRQPLMIPEPWWASWLLPGIPGHTLVEQIPAVPLHCWPVSRNVGSVRHDHPGLLLPQPDMTA